MRARVRVRVIELGFTDYIAQLYLELGYHFSAVWMLGGSQGERENEA